VQSYQSDYTYDTDDDSTGPPPLLVRDLLLENSSNDSDGDPAPITYPRTGLFDDSDDSDDSEEDEWTFIRVLPVMLSSVVARSSDGLFHPFLDPYSSASENDDDETYTSGVEDLFSTGTEHGWYRGYHDGRLVRYEKKHFVVFPSNKQDDEHKDDESTI
jgi:hypothetical protein